MKSILKWPGGKERELPIIRKYLPAYSGRFIEPFVGGGAVFFDTDNTNCCINDKSSELINLYRCIQNNNLDFKKYLQLESHEFLILSNFIDKHGTEILALYKSNITVDNFIKNNIDTFSAVAHQFNGIFISELKKNLSSKIRRSAKLENTHGKISDADRVNNIEAAIKSAYYMYIRYLLNNSAKLSNGQQAAVFFFIREYCYSSMFRYNAKGDFNVPYGGISYNRKDFAKKINYLFSAELAQKLTAAKIYCDDFEPFLDSLNLTAGDFIFLDPPYDNEFSTYAQNEFGLAEQNRLFHYLKNTPAKILLIIKNTDFIYSLYKNDFNITSFDKKYTVSFMSRNNQQAKHLLITNY